MPNRDRRDPIRSGLSALLFVVLGLGLGACAASPGGGASTPAIPEGARDPEELFVVDCLLPGQVRKMGVGLTYMTPPRPVRTSAIDCEIRGGEYVAFDRATYADSLRVWLPLAKEGDATAQTYVGEIFEKGLGVRPDYRTAAEWYQRAASAGYGPAQINLGQLYELGHGVPKDPAKALELYRQASGLADHDLEYVAFVGNVEEQKRVRDELAKRSSEVASLRGEISSLHAQLSRLNARRDDASSRVSGDREALDQQRSELERERRELESRRQSLQEQQARLAAERDAVGRAGEELASLKELQAQVDAEEDDLRTYADELLKREQDALIRERALDAREKELLELDARIKALGAQAEAERAAYEQEVRQRVDTPLPGPSIQIVDPALALTRGPRAVELAVQSRELKIVGRVEAPAGLLSLMVNDVPEQVDADGFFATRVRVRAVGTPVQIVAIDEQGKRADRSFVLRRSTEKSADPGPADWLPMEVSSGGIDFGRYHALVIGNSEYEHMPELVTARPDAEAVSEVLERRYGFEVTTLYDADRYTILSALNELRGRLEENDNLIIYYAGHGEIDQANERGYWLPIDAEKGNSANWISNLAITDVVDAMEARHVLVIADSCYSGSLTETSIARPDDDITAGDRKVWYERILEKRSRTALTSGGVAPVLDEGSGSHSVFAGAFLEILRSNHDVLGARELYEEISARVAYNARTRSFRQEPRYAPIRFGRHEAGDFFFVPRV